MRDYELVFVVSPEVGEEETGATVDRISKSITDQGGSVNNHEQWGMLRLAYPIKKFYEGKYFFTEFTIGPHEALQLEATVRSSQEILRHLLIKKAKKKASLGDDKPVQAE